MARILPSEATQTAEVSVLEIDRNPVIQRMPPPYPNLLPVQIRAFPDNLFIFIILDFFFKKIPHNLWYIQRMYITCNTLSNWSKKTKFGTIQAQGLCVSFSYIHSSPKLNSRTLPVSLTDLSASCPIPMRVCSTFCFSLLYVGGACGGENTILCNQFSFYLYMGLGIELKNPCI